MQEIGRRSLLAGLGMTALFAMPGETAHAKGRQPVFRLHRATDRSPDLHVGSGCRERYRCHLHASGADRVSRDRASEPARPTASRTRGGSIAGGADHQQRASSAPVWAVAPILLLPSGRGRPISSIKKRTR